LLEPLTLFYLLPLHSPKLTLLAGLKRINFANFFTFLRDF